MTGIIIQRKQRVAMKETKQEWKVLNILFGFMNGGREKQEVRLQGERRFE